MQTPGSKLGVSPSHAAGNVVDLRFPKLEGDRRVSGTTLSCVDTLEMSGRPRYTYSGETAGAYTRLWRAVLFVALLLGCALVAASYIKTDVYQTPVGVIRTVQLGDGSVLVLNTDSEVKVRYTPFSRFAEVRRGEVLFDFAADSDRPLRVRAGSTSLQKLGNVFAIRLNDGGPAEVLKLRSRTKAASASLTSIRNGQVTHNTLAAPEVTRRLAWTEGRLVFSNTPLSEAVAQFNRYSRSKLVLKDPSRANARISGAFSVNDADGFVSAVEAVVGVRLREDRP